MAYEYYDSEVVDIIDETDVVKRFYIKVSDDVEFRFKAGQFIMLDLPLNSKVNNRSYSIASAPTEDNIYELCIVLKPGGLGTTYLFNEVSVGTHLKTSRPLGKFTLPDPIDKDICFICTGTGIAPLRSMLCDIANKQLSHKAIHMVFGNRWTKDILYKKEMEDCTQSMPDFHFHPVLSRETPDTWSGDIGYVHAVYEKLFSDKRPAYFYICGWADMLKEARQRLEAMGYDRKSIKFESYD